jgi:hypothetical protein
MTKSNLVGCSTGMSPGFVPRRILSTNSAVRRNRWIVWSVRHETPDLDKFAGIEDRRQPSAERKCDDARAVDDNECIDHDIKCIRSGLRLEDGSDILCSPDFEWRDFDAERASRGLNLTHLQLGLGKANIKHDCQPAETRDDLTQEFEPLTGNEVAHALAAPRQSGQSKKAHVRGDHIDGPPFNPHGIRDSDQGLFQASSKIKIPTTREFFARIFDLCTVRLDGQ